MLSGSPGALGERFSSGGIWRGLRSGIKARYLIGILNTFLPINTYSALHGCHVITLISCVSVLNLTSVKY